MPITINGTGTVAGITAGGLPDSCVVADDISSGAVTQAKLASNVTTTGPAFRAFATASTTGLTSSVAKKIELAGETFDTANCFASSRFTANVAGYYFISAGVRFEALTNASAMLGKNGAIHSVGSTPNAGNYHSVVSDLIYLNGTTDYIELFGIQYSGTTQNTGIADSPGTFMSGFLARAA